MTDYEGEQAMELEALEAILMDDLQEFDETNPDGWRAVGLTYKILIDPTEEGEEPADDEKLMELLFAHTQSYPDEAPCLRLRAVRGLSDGDMAEANGHMQDLIQENMGMAMIFTLVQAAKEWLQARAGASAAEDPEAMKKRLEAEEEAKRAAIRAHGTMFTMELFNEWKAKFDKEVADAKAKKAAELMAKEPDRVAWPTGKQWFLQNSSRAEADDLAAQAAGLSEDEEDFMDAEEDEEDIDFDDDDDDDDLDLDALLAAKAAVK